MCQLPFRGRDLRPAPLPLRYDSDNFMKDHWDRIVAHDFGASCFLPPSFFNLARREGDDFTQLIARLIKPPKSTQLNAMLMTHYFSPVWHKQDR